MNDVIDKKHHTTPHYPENQLNIDISTVCTTTCFSLFITVYQYKQWYSEEESCHNENLV